MDPVDLERLLDRELKRLPGPRAPQTLMPRVIAAARQKLVPWYQRPWITWPLALQTASIVLLTTVLAGIAFVLPSVQHASSSLISGLSVPATLAGIARRAQEAAALMNVVLQVFLQPVAVYLFALAIALMLACSALWSALNRIALGGAHQ
jgi:hypothetical protein